MAKSWGISSSWTGIIVCHVSCPAPPGHPPDALARQLVDEVYEMLGGRHKLSKDVQKSPRRQKLHVTSRPGKRGGLRRCTLPWSSSY